MKSKWLFGPCILASALLSAGSVHAQGGTGSNGERTLDEVVVTAQKRAQDLQEVPSSVAALTDEKLDNLNASGFDIRLLSSRVPSLHIESSYGRTLPRFYIRGLGNTDFDLNASQPVSLVYDEVVLENPILKGFPIFDLERVEVLRGPQGTLFGRNTPAGIVKFDSKKPTEELDGFGRFSYGRFNSMQFEGGLGGPLVEDRLAARVSLLYQGRSDWVDNTFTGDSDVLGGYDDFAGRVQFLLTPTPEFSALLNVHLRDLDGTARLFRANIIEPGTAELVSNFDREKMAVDGQNQQELKEKGGVAKLEYDAGRVTLTSVTGFETADLFSRGDVDGGFGAVFLPSGGGPGLIPFPAETADAIPDLDQITQELRVASNRWDQVNFQTGFFYFNEDLTIDSINFDTLAPGQPQNGFATQTQETSAWAVFGTVEVDATDSFTVTGGIRYSSDEKDFVAERTISPDPNGVPLAPVTVNPDDSVVGWDLSGLLAVNEDVNVYARVARGFRAPSIQGRVLFTDSVTVAETETILSFETGVKTTLLDGAARANVSVFHYLMNDQQLTAVGGTANVNTLLNADKTRGTGFEADLEFLATAQTLMTAGISYNKTEIDDPNLGIAPGGAAGLTVLDPPLAGSPGIVSLDGNSLPNAPEWVLNGTLRSGMDVGRRGEVFFFTDWAYRSRVQFFLYESVEFQEKQLVEGGVRVGYSLDDRTLEIAAFGRNILDDESRTGGIDFNNLTGFVNEPRTFGIELRSAL